MTDDADSRARTHLANERTFLAWFRTGLTLVAFGVAAAQFLDGRTSTDTAVVPLFSTLVISIGVVLVAVGLWRYLRGRMRIDAEGYDPASTSIVVTSVVAVGAGLMAIVLVWLLRPV